MNANVDEAALAALLDKAFEFLCERRVGEIVDTDRVLAMVDAVGTLERVTRFTARFVVPARTRLLALAGKSELLLAEWLPPASRDVLANFLGQPMPIPRKLVDEAVASERVRDSVRALLQESLSSVISRGFQATPGGGKGLRGVIGFGARAAGAAGRGIFGGLGDELQRQVEERVRDFVDGGVGMVQTRIAQKLSSEETARELGVHLRHGFLDLLKKTEAMAAKFLGHAPHELIDALVPVIVTHNLARKEVRDALRTEVDATLAQLSKQTIGELLDELGLRELARTATRERLGPLAVAFVASPQFAAWLKR